MLTVRGLTGLNTTAQIATDLRYLKNSFYKQIWAFVHFLATAIINFD
jgi:hypothetical protein